MRSTIKKLVVTDQSVNLQTYCVSRGVRCHPKSHAVLFAGRYFCVARLSAHVSNIYLHCIRLLAARV